MENDRENGGRLNIKGREILKAIYLSVMSLFSTNCEQFIRKTQITKENRNHLAQYVPIHDERCMSSENENVRTRK